jgi:hypothetical protein
MRISHRYKFVFISKPRCASTTVRKLLDPFSDIVSSQSHPYHHHTTASRLKAHFAEIGWDWERYFKFITLRNPWTMLVSLYHFGLPDTNGKYFWQRYLPEIEEKGYSPLQQRIPENLIPFSAWLFEYDFTIYTLNYYINDSHGHSLVDTIIPYEKLSTELPKIAAELGFSVGKMPYLCKTKKVEDISGYYGPRQRARVEDLFAEDIARGKYSFR